MRDVFCKRGRAQNWLLLYFTVVAPVSQKGRWMKVEIQKSLDNPRNKCGPRFTLIHIYLFFSLLLNTSVGKVEEGMHTAEVFKPNSEMRCRKG